MADCWSQIDFIKSGLRRLASAQTCFTPIRRSFQRFAEREQNSGDADNLSIEISSSLMRLYSIISTLNPTVPDNLAECASKLNTLTQDIDKFLIEYHRESPETRASEAFKWRKEAHEHRQVELMNAIADLKMDFEDYIDAHGTQPLAPPPPVSVKSEASIDETFDPRSESLTGMEIKAKNRKIKLRGAPMVGSKNIVWRVEQLSTSAIYAAKFYTVKEMFERERDLLKLVNGHRHVISFKIIIEDAPQAVWSPYNILIMDYCEITLRELWDETRSQKDLNHGRVVLSDIISGLEFCHRNNVIHCDLKPENVMLFRPNVKEERWIIVDFDSARKLGEPVTLNTLKYGAPEVVRAHVNGDVLAATAAVDVWGLGRIVYFLATSFPLWPDNTTDDAMIGHLLNNTYTLRDDVMDARTLPEVKELLQHDPLKRKRLDAFKTCSYMTNTHSTKELRRVEKEVRSDLKDTMLDVQRNLSMKIDDVQMMLLQELSNVRTQMLSIESQVIPRIFAIQPKPKEKGHIFKKIASLGREELMLYFYCEAEIPHLAPHEGYELNRPSAFIRKYGPLIACSLRVLQFALKVAPLPIGEVIPTELIDMVGMKASDVTSKMINYTNGLLTDAAGDIDSLSTETIAHPFQGVQDGSRTILDEGMQKAFLEEFIKVHDKTYRLGNLKRCTLRQNGKIVWLCNACSKRLDVIVAETDQELAGAQSRIGK